MGRISILILEDEPLHAAKLEILLEEMNYHVLPIASSAAEAMTAFRATEPDLVILDVRVNGDEDGVSVAKRLNEIGDGQLPIVFLTSLNDSKTFERAKETNPYAFLLKPIDRFSLQHTIELALQKTLTKREMETGRALEAGLLKGRSIFIKERSRLFKVDLSLVEVIEVDARHCQLFTADKRYLVRSSLRTLMERLPADLFIQTHRNFLVNAEAIQDIELDKDLINTTTREVPVSKNFKASILKNLDYLM